MRCTQPCRRQRAGAVSGAGAGRKRQRCGCLDLLLLSALMGALGYAGVNMWERFAISRTLETMRLNLDAMKKMVANTGKAYDDLHNEIDRLTSTAIPKTVVMDKQTSSRNMPSSTEHKISQSDTIHSQDTCVQAIDGNKCKPKMSEQENQKSMLDVNCRAGLTPSSHCSKKCMFLPVGEYCGNANCKNKDVCLDKKILDDVYSKTTNKGSSYKQCRKCQLKNNCPKYACKAKSSAFFKIF